jgi:hypothetical protein
MKTFSDDSWFPLGHLRDILCPVSLSLDHLLPISSLSYSPRLQGQRKQEIVLFIMHVLHFSSQT